MKSNEEFIAGIYEKAKHKEQGNVVQVNSFRKKIRKYSAVAAGFLTVCVCGISAYIGKQDSAKEESVNRMVEENVGEKARTASVMEEQGQYILCEVNHIKMKNGVVYVKVTKVDGTSFVIEIPKESYDAKLKEKDEIAVFASTPNEKGNYSILSSSDIYVYSGKKNGKKVFTSDNNSVITEDEISQNK